MTHIITFTHRKIDPLAPDPSLLVLADIAHALSMLCRYTGHTSEFYSVAEHCVHVSDLLPLEHALTGLMHDASEAYLSDLSGPLKASGKMGQYLKAEKRLMDVIAREFGFAFPLPKEVVAMDEALLHAEMEQLFRGYYPYGRFPNAAKITVACWSPKEAERQFLNRFHALK